MEEKKIVSNFEENTAVIIVSLISNFIKSDMICLLLSIPETSNSPQNNVTVPLLMPLITLMERQAVIFEGMDLWESSDQSCEIMLKHLATARQIAQNAEMYSLTAEQMLEGREQCRRHCCTLTQNGGYV